MAFRCQIPIRFGDIDQAGIAYYPTLFDHCHVAFEEFFSHAIGIPYPTVIKRDRLGFPAAHLEADFHEPLRFGDQLSVEVSVLRIGRSSVVFQYRAFRRPARTPAFEVRSTTVCVDMRTLRPRAVPPRYRRLLGRHLHRGAR